MQFIQNGQSAIINKSLIQFDNNIMEKQFECIKIKDGLYLGNKIVAYDLEFLIINKFGYIVNCAAEVQNLFQQHGIKYTKFKIKQEKNQKIFDQDFKRLTKIKKVINEAEENGLCCLVHCNKECNRSLVLITAYLMDRFKWRLRKTLQYLQSKGVFIALSDSNIEELTNLEYILSKQHKLSHMWIGDYVDQEQELISKTFNNTTKANNPRNGKPNSPIKKDLPKQDQIQEKIEKRVQWQDKIQKQQKKEKRKALAEKMKEEKKQYERSRQKFEEQFIHKDSKTHNFLMPKEKIELNKKSKKKLSGQLDPEIRKKIQQAEIIKLLKKSDKLKKELALDSSNKIENYEPEHQISDEKPEKPKQKQNEDKKVYKLTINNYINPNINIIKPPLDKKKKVKVAQKKQKDKFNRTYSEKQAFKKSTFYDQPLSKQKDLGREKRNAGYTPIRSRKERKSQNEK